MGRILRFLTEVKYEALKISWMTRKEAAVSTMIVVGVVVVFSILFVFVDFMFFHFVQFILNIRF